MQAAILILNYNGRELLARCLPSVLSAAATSRYACRVFVIDNSSSDGSRAWLAGEYPNVEVVVRPNRGLCSFNDVLAELDEPVAVLLNNDIELYGNALDELIGPLLEPRSSPRCFLTAPLLWQLDGRTYEGQRTSIQWRYGLVRATSQFDGYESGMLQQGETACAGAALAVDRELFVQLGGFDPLYLPGRLEDLDLCYRAFQAGYRCLHVPAAQGLHLGMATFARYYAAAGCDYLALRNTLLFQWKNLRCLRHRVRMWAGLALRVIKDVLCGPLAPGERRWLFLRALRGAWRRRGMLAHERQALCANRELAYFRKFHPSVMRADSLGTQRTHGVLHAAAGASESSGLLGSVTGGAHG